MRKRKSTSSPVFGSGSFAPCGRTFSHAAMASPTIRSTGLVKAVMVLLTGTSSKQTASAGRESPVPGTVTSSLCQRMQPTRRRTISLRRYEPKITELWTFAQGRNRRISEASDERPEQVVDDPFDKALSMSPNGRCVVRLRTITDVPDAWSAYEPAPNEKHLRI